MHPAPSRTQDVTSFTHFTAGQSPTWPPVLPRAVGMREALRGIWTLLQGSGVPMGRHTSLAGGPRSLREL